MGASSISLDRDVLATTPPASAAHERPEAGECDACPRCADACDDADCASCRKKLSALHDCCEAPCWLGWLRGSDRGCKTYTRCQLRRHRTPSSAWILVGTEIYDATPYLDRHPGGTEAILKKTGGAKDCAEDLGFHSRRAQKEWRRHRVGTLVECRGRR
ncbi:hypothetical protein ACHAWF_002148 [Thalassiosira exigua]